MSGATSNVIDGDILGALADGNAIITSSDDAVEYINESGSA